MKLTTIFLAGMLLVLSICSCKKQNFLDPVSVNDLNEQTVFADSARTMNFLAGIYTSNGFSFNPNRFLSSCVDESDYRWTGGTQIPVRFAMGSLGAGSAVLPTGDVFTTCYQRIRQANLFLKKVEISPLSSTLKDRTKAEARFLRGWYYVMLMKHYGGVQMVKDSVYGINDVISLPRSSYSDCVEYVVNEMDEAAQKLPLAYTGLDYGRVTKGACMALKARVLLYAASPLFNGGTIATSEELKKQTGYPTADPQRWNRAAQAALDVINLGQYQLYTGDGSSTKPGIGFYQVFLKRVNSEYIFAQMMGPNKTSENNYNPPSRNSGDPQHYPLQNLVDQFGMKDGTAYIPSVSDNNPYVNRDPRFYYSIIYNGSSMYRHTTSSQQQVFTYVGAPTDGINLDNTFSTPVTRTGYYTRKMCDTTTASNGGGNTDRCYPLIRYAEILLNYAEASNEAGNSTIAIDQLKLIRQRAGILPGVDGNYGIPLSPSKEDLRIIIQRERAVELAFEEHRFWDVRRWKIGPQTETVPMQGIKITKTGAVYTYERFNLTRQHYWPANNSYYLMPIAQTEVSKLPGVLLQNPGW